jgi:hypothetical protein
MNTAIMFTMEGYTMAFFGVCLGILLMTITFR